MANNTLKKLSDQFCPRFGQIAVNMGYISESQLKEALCQQVDENLSGKKHRLLGTILFEKGWMSSDQVEEAMNTLLEKIENESQD